MAKPIGTDFRISISDENGRFIDVGRVERLRLPQLPRLRRIRFKLLLSTAAPRDDWADITIFG